MILPFRPYRVACAICILFGSLVCIPSIGKTEDYRIGAWNIEWLGFPNMRGRPGKDIPQKATDLADYLASANLDVLSLEEIGVDNPTAPWTSKQLDELFSELKVKHQQPWKYILFAKTNYPEGTEDFVVRGQHTGLAWRTDRCTLVGEPYSISVGENATYGIKFWERRATAIKLSFGAGKTDVVFLPVHLKSNRNDANNEKDFTQKQRLTEVQVLVEQLQNIKNHFHDDDIVILGDTNMLAPEDETAKPLIAADFIDLNQQDEGTTAAWGEGYSSAPFDRFFVPKSQPEFRQTAQRIHRTKNGTDQEIKEFKTKLSDHYLISCIVAVGNDDD